MESPDKVGTSLDPLISFAKETLAGKEHQFKYFPVYLKATGTHARTHHLLTTARFLALPPAPHATPSQSFKLLLKMRLL